MRNITCERCGAEYEVVEHGTPVRAQDSFQCNCGQTLMRQKEVVFHKFKLVKLGEEPEKTEHAISDKLPQRQNNRGGFAVWYP